MKPTKPGFYWFTDRIHGFEPVKVVHELSQLTIEYLGTDIIDLVEDTKDSDWGEEIKRS